MYTHLQITPIKIFIALFLIIDPISLQYSHRIEIVLHCILLFYCNPLFLALLLFVFQGNIRRGEIECEVKAKFLIYIIYPRAIRFGRKKGLCSVMCFIYMERFGSIETIIFIFKNKVRYSNSRLYMSQSALKRSVNVICKLARPVLSASSLFSCTLFMGDVIGQYISSRSSNV